MNKRRPAKLGRQQPSKNHRRKTIPLRKRARPYRRVGAENPQGEEKSGKDASKGVQRAKTQQYLQNSASEAPPKGAERDTKVGGLEPPGMKMFIG